MKKLFLIILFVNIQSFSQIKVIDSIKIADLEIPNSPALTLLDKSFSLIETSNTTNSVNSSMVNLKDNSIELIPFWLFNKNKFSSSDEYYGFTISDSKKKQNIFNDIKKISISVANSTTDTISSIAFGFKTNLITIRDIKTINKKFNYYSDYDKKRKEYIDDNKQKLFVTDPDFIQKYKDAKTPEEKIALDNEASIKLSDDYDDANKKENEKVISNFLNAFNHKVFTLDIAAGSSILFPDNKTDNGRLGRYGFWSTAKYSAILSDDNKDYFNLYGYGRLLFDKTILDGSSTNYIENKYVDIGGKLEFQFNKTTISAEYLNRNGDQKDYRLVGTLQYKIQENLYLTGGYGKNFDTITGNLVSLFGIKWGLSEKPIAKAD